MFEALQQLLPETLSAEQLLSILILVAGLDAFIVLSAVSLGVLFVSFKAGKLVYDAIDKLIEWAVLTVLRIIEDVLESPPLDKIPVFQLALVAVKMVYDAINGAQRLLEFAINLAVTALAAALIILFALALASVNLAALSAVVYYLT